MTDRKEALAAWIREGGGVAGTLHLVSNGELELAAAHNIPEKVIAVTRTIPKGKGMAGLAWARLKPVQTCNLQDDETGDVRPGAKAVDAKAAVAIPLTDRAGEVIAVAGLAYMDNRELSDEFIARLATEAQKLLG
jgi:L-methionine (R)-S-oxide reductase